jgi:predicted transcriptional regulator
MAYIDIKKKLIKRINDSKNELLLEEMFRLIDNEEADDIMQLSTDQKTAVSEGQEDYRCGRIITNEDLDKEIDEWLRG